MQESLSNASRHAPGAPVRVAIEYGLALVSLSVVNEAPTAPQQVSHDAAGGSGIGGMRDRALAVGGILTATPRAEGGFEVMAQLPVGVVAGFANHSA